MLGYNIRIESLFMFVSPDDGKKWHYPRLRKHHVQLVPFPWEQVKTFNFYLSLDKDFIDLAKKSIQITTYIVFFFSKKRVLGTH